MTSLPLRRTPFSNGQGDRLGTMTPRTLVVGNTPDLLF